ncbi:uncharacterized protein PHACADRAFT_85276 [Phanerochaete carnosa HHB-10118-sp]|uniref:Uncharacterized protein n=1 Tax=Phanerochaete carnosa (strain HHB-10118-sp) TaxID=650164 RepID=K5WQ34_PHACS|nr:uncharacterized protein PHACADRAFT_85276 [Phanerochaete carnosa HHB-10118-sp]EKM61590.1 hypothetical protein PHACADRAFT_85276 [Phanerochaete carnosa HHB-10118-sp]
MCLHAEIRICPGLPRAYYHPSFVPRQPSKRCRFQRHIMEECSRYDKYRDSAPRSVDATAARRRVVRKGQLHETFTRAKAHRQSCTPERQAQSQTVLFIDPQQRRTLESVRQCRAHSHVSPSDVPSAERKLLLGAKTLMRSRDVSEDREDMDISSDSEDVFPQPVRCTTPAKASTRDVTPALSFVSSDAETESTALDDYGDWQQPSPDENQSLFYGSQDSSLDLQKTPLFSPSPMFEAMEKTTTLAFELQYPEEDVCPVRRFLDSLCRPVGHRYATFYALGIRSREDIRALSTMPHEWDTVQAELLKKDVTLMEWLYVKAGLEKICREELGALQPKLECEG